MYYFVNIQDLEDGSSPKSILEYQTFDEADAQFHYEMWYAKTNIETFKAIKCLILNADGNTIKLEVWNKPEPAPNPETPTEE